MTGPTLSIYLARRFVLSVVMVFATVFVLIFLIDLVELLRRAGDTQGASTPVLAGLALYRVPSVAEQIMPFAVLFGGVATFLALSRRLELVVLRAAGISAWQFLAPALLAALALGLLAVGAYNPLAAELKRRADVTEARIFARANVAASERGVWIRQRSIDGEAVIRAEQVADGGATLTGLAVFVFDERGIFLERIEAETASLQRGYWRLENARVITPGVEPQTAKAYLLASNLTLDQVREVLGSSENVSFWSLPAIISRLDLAGLDSTRYRLRYQSLLARPLLLAAMVLVAASVSLRFFRFGGVARMVTSGVVAGFVLYVATKVGEDLGSAGSLSTVASAWMPVALGSLLGVLALLHQEDG